MNSVRFLDVIFFEFDQANNLSYGLSKIIVPNVQHVECRPGSWNTLQTCVRLCLWPGEVWWGYRLWPPRTPGAGPGLSNPRSSDRSRGLSWAWADWHLFNQRFLVKLKQFRQEHWAVSSGQPTTENLGDIDIFIDKHTLLIKVIPTTNSLSHR